MRVKLELDRALGLLDEFSRIWFTLDEHENPTIGDCADKIRSSLELSCEHVGIEFEGFRLLNYQHTQKMLQDGCTLRVFPAQASTITNNVDGTPTRKRLRTFEPLFPSPSPTKQPKMHQLHVSPHTKPSSTVTAQARGNTKHVQAKQTQTPKAPASSTSSSSSTQSSSESSDRLSSSTSSASDSDHESSTTSTTSSPSSSSSSSSSAPEPPLTEDSSPILETETVVTHIAQASKQRTRQNKRNRLAMKQALNDTVQTVSRLYVNHMPSTSSLEVQNSGKANGDGSDPVQIFDYDHLPSISLDQVKVGQIVAWRTLVLTPLRTADLSPWQERQLVSISSDGQLTFLSHNLNAYLSTWWYDEEGEQLCTVKEWLESGIEETPLQVTIPVDTSFEDLRLLHSADVS